jgi:hypothetical protein
MQTLPAQKAPGAQSVENAQLVVQAEAPHMYGAHDVGAGALHVPRPSQVLGPVNIDAAHEVVASHGVPAGKLRHPPVWHLPSVPQLDASFTAHWSRGSGLPSITGLQVPFATPVKPVKQAWQALVHAVSQQKPSTQKPLTHSSAAPQSAPFAAFGTHAPATQRFPLAQCASLAQLVEQATALQP